MSERAPGRRTFGPVVLVGLAGTGLTALASDHDVVAPDASAAQTALLAFQSTKLPLALALGLVGMAAWGVVLVTRGRVRRSVAALGLLTALGAVASVVTGWFSSASSLKDALAGVGVQHPVVHHTGWWWTALVGSLLAMVAAAIAVRLVPRWPEMGSRYDAPVAAAPSTTGPDADSLELWRALDDGQDPTADDPGRVS